MGPEIVRFSRSGIEPRGFFIGCGEQSCHVSGLGRFWEDKGDEDAE
jgi:hypothetical protein